MSDFDNTNSFVLFTNNKKEKENQPDYQGKITLADGTEMRLAAWLRESKSGSKFLSGKLSEFQDQTPAPEKKKVVEDSSDDLPF